MLLQTPMQSTVSRRSTMTLAYLTTVALCTIAACGLVAAVVIHLLIQRKLIEGVPRLPLWPILGNGHLFLNNTPSGIVKLLGGLLQQCGKRFQVALGPDLIFFTADAKDFEVSFWFIALNSHKNRLRSFTNAKRFFFFSFTGDS